jgi:hypothetical protein
MIVEVLSLARHHDDMLKETRQDLFRTETKLNVERRWKWPTRFGCVALGAASVLAFQNEALKAWLAESAERTFEGMSSAGNATLIGLVVAGIALYGLVWFIRRTVRGPTPEKTARKLMQQFAQRDGVAAYVFGGDDSPDDGAASIGALTSEKKKNFRQRKLTATNRPLASSLQRLLNRTDDNQPLLH